MESSAVETFLTVYRTGSFTRASGYLHVTQSTISHRLKTLEAAVGTRLFERGRGVREAVLTPEGEHFLALAERFTDLLSEATRIRSDKGGSLAIGAPDSFNTYLLPPVYQYLSQRTPNLRLRIETNDSPELYKRVTRRDIDVAFVQYEQFAPEMRIDKLLHEPMVVVSKNCTLGMRNIINLRKGALDAVHEVSSNWGRAYQVWHQQWWGSDSGGVHVTPGRMILPFIRRRENWAVVPLSMARSLAVGENWSIYKISPPPPDRIVYRVQPEHPTSSVAQNLAALDRAFTAVKKKLTGLCSF